MRASIFEFEFISVLSSANNKLINKVLKGRSLIYTVTEIEAVQGWTPVGRPEKVRSELIDLSILTNCLRLKS
jgi:hypothetical protein